MLGNNMFVSTLEKIESAIKANWGPLSTQLISDVSGHISALLKTSSDEAWLAELHASAPLKQEMFRDGANGYVLLAHTEPTHLYRPPHDHGRGWVIYAVQHGEIEMGTYGKIIGTNGKAQLVKRNATLVRAGQIQVYLPGDIHDTLCVRGPALLFRFSDRDLRREDVEAHQVTRYEMHEGVWTVGSA
jgi:hypothetical protein